VAPPTTTRALSTETPVATVVLPPSPRPVPPPCVEVRGQPGPCIVGVDVPTEPTGGQPFVVTVHASNIGVESGYGTISISLPDGATAEAVGSDAEQAPISIYSPGQNVGQCLNFKEGRCAGFVNREAQYVLAERTFSSWKKGDQHTLSVKIVPQAGQVSVQVLVRLAMLASSGDRINYPTESSVVDSQQNFPAIQYSVRVARPGDEEERALAEVEALAWARAPANTKLYKDVNLDPVRDLVTGEALALYQSEADRLKSIGAWIDTRQIFFGLGRFTLEDADHATVATVEVWDSKDHLASTGEITASRRARVAITYRMVRQDRRWWIDQISQDILSMDPLPNIALPQ
jgi:hypothetical protein